MLTIIEMIKSKYFTCYYFRFLHINLFERNKNDELNKKQTIDDKSISIQFQSIKN